MAITSSAKKAIRGSARKRVFNLARRDAYKDAIKSVRKLITEKQFEEAKKALDLAYKAIDKAAKTNYIKKSRLALSVNKAK